MSKSEEYFNNNNEGELKMSKVQKLLKLVEYVGCDKFELVTKDNWGHLEIGDYIMSHSNEPMDKVEFLGWFGKDGKELDPNEEDPEKVILKFKDKKYNDEFDVYHHNGKFCIGSSADPIKLKSI